ncbi:hypothetical protein AYI68_g8375 [Smittium mucronatum]|uniref:Uncharacterized protein n=1 Tax=Smittium mucronatum TaxID=133383 RepID=A0A1R0GL32_9FUNG|nr:hypothetical protein AYI68_g8375 [Smittium mucronatum]
MILLPQPHECVSLDPPHYPSLHISPICAVSRLLFDTHSHSHSHASASTHYTQAPTSLFFLLFLLAIQSPHVSPFDLKNDVNPVFLIKKDPPKSAYEPPPPPPLPHLAIIFFGCLSAAIGKTITP